MGKIGPALLAALLACGAEACAPSEAKLYDANVKGPTSSEQAGSASLVFPSYWTRQEREALADAARAHIARFEALEGVRIPACEVAIINTLVALWRGETTGVCEADAPRIVVFADEHLDVPALYHELAHLVFARTDYAHADPRWPVWDLRGEAVEFDLERRPSEPAILAAEAARLAETGVIGGASWSP